MAKPNTHLNFTRYEVRPDGCWIWNGNTVGPNKAHPTAYSYGRFRWLGKSYLAHRASWLIHKGPIPSGAVVCHKCDVTLCVNPDHLFLGTHKDNMQDAVKKGRSCRGSQVWRSVLTEDDVRTIRASSKTSYALAKEYGVDRSQISRIRKFEAWVNSAADVCPQLKQEAA